MLSLPCLTYYIILILLTLLHITPNRIDQTPTGDKKKEVNQQTANVIVKKLMHKTIETIETKATTYMSILAFRCSLLYNAGQPI